MRVGINSLQSSISAFSTDLKEFKLSTDYSWILEQIKSLQINTNPLVRRQSSSFSPSSSPCMSGNNFQRLFQKTIEGFDCKINDRALEAALRHSLGWSDGRAQTQGFFRVGGCHCRQQQARLRKKCYHSCDAESLLLT